MKRQWDERRNKLEDEFSDISGSQLIRILMAFKTSVLVSS